jgi:hypothetical protein
VCAEVGIAWERPRNPIVYRFPAVMKHYLTCPVKPSLLRTLSMQPPPGMEPPARTLRPAWSPATESPAGPPRSSVKDHVSELFRYSFEGWRESACDQDRALPDRG